MDVESGKRWPIAAGATDSKACIWMIKRTDTALLRGSLEISTTEITSTMTGRATEKCTGQMAVSTAESGVKASSMAEE